MVGGAGFTLLKGAGNIVQTPTPSWCRWFHIGPIGFSEMIPGNRGCKHGTPYAMVPVT
jgi:hypothetical protein